MCNSFSDLWFGSFLIILKKQFLVRMALSTGRVEEWQCSMEKVCAGTREAAEAGEPTESGGWWQWQKKGTVSR